jgi:hypothetical protein
MRGVGRRELKQPSEFFFKTGLIPFIFVYKKPYVVATAGAWVLCPETLV